MMETNGLDMVYLNITLLVTGVDISVKT